MVAAAPAHYARPSRRQGWRARTHPPMDDHQQSDILRTRRIRRLLGLLVVAVALTPGSALADPGGRGPAHATAIRAIQAQSTHATPPGQLPPPAETPPAPPAESEPAPQSEPEPAPPA